MAGHWLTTTVLVCSFFIAVVSKDVVCNETHLADVIFVLDSSASITDADYTDQLQFVAQVTANFQLGPDNVRFGALVFSQDTQKLFDLKDYSSHSELQSAILGAAHLKRGTDTAKALNFVSDQDMFGTKAGGRYNSTKILIIMTDGRSNSMEETVQAADRLKTDGVKFISIGIGSDIYLDELQQLAGDNGSLFTVAGFSALQEIKDKVTIRTCQLPSQLAHDTTNVCARYMLLDGVYPDPGSCPLFLQCSNFYTYHHSCPGGLHFSTATRACDHANVVDCQLNFNYYSNL
jgi:hypothetical protein